MNITRESEDKGPKPLLRKLSQGFAGKTKKYEALEDTFEEFPQDEDVTLFLWKKNLLFVVQHDDEPNKLWENNWEDEGNYIFLVAKKFRDSVVLFFSFQTTF